MAWVNSDARGFRGQEPVDLPPVVTATPHGRVHAFLTERGSVVVENAPGQATLDAEGYGFLLGLEFGAGLDDGCVVGPYEAAVRPERHGHEAERRARDAVESAMHGAAAAFMAEHEQLVLARATESLRARLAEIPADADGTDPAMASEHEAEDDEAPDPKAFATTYETPYGPVEGVVRSQGRVEVTGAGVQGSIVVDGRMRALKGTLDPLHPQRPPALSLRDVFSTDRRRSYAWQSDAPDLSALAAAAASDPDTLAACRARAEADERRRLRASRVAARVSMTADLRRLTARLDALDPEAASFPAP